MWVRGIGHQVLVNISDNSWARAKAQPVMRRSSRDWRCRHKGYTYSVVKV